MAIARANGIDIEYETFGDPTDPVMLLIMGLGGQLIAWDADFCNRLAAHGFRVIRFDNRDVGLSTKIEAGPVPDIMAVIQGDRSSVSYSLEDMAADATGLLDALGVEKAHIVGVSMGGMIAQVVAIDHPDRVLSLASIMSTTGDPSVGAPTPEAMAVLMRPPPQERDDVIAGEVETHKAIGSPGFPVDEERTRRRAAAAYDRSFYPQGVARQVAAVVAASDRTEGLSHIDVPTVVIHGTADPLVTPSGGEATAKAVPGAELIMVEGMGHELPPGAWETVVEAVVRNAAKAGSR
ncbi:MAG TPA: alpha/beta hydrolase [Acidimicrobiales bacterium]|nr:alpha/beta hydrolase [Acidimicrobiales bacterium]